MTGFKPPHSARAAAGSAGAFQGSIPVQEGLKSQQPRFQPAKPAKPAKPASSHSDSKYSEQHVHGTPASSPSNPPPSQNPVPAPRRLVSRILVMVGVFVVGTTVGISAVWWVHQNPEDVPLSASREPLQASAVSVPTPVQSGRANVLRGINPAELPYDGARPSLAEPAPQETQQAAAFQPSEEASITGSSSATNMPESKPAPQADVPILPEPPPSSGMQAAQRAASEPKISTPAASPKPSARNQQKQKTLDSEAKSESRSKNSGSTVAKDREIERIKQQADKELQRKLEIGRAAEEARTRKQQAARSNNRSQITAMRESREARVRKILAKCEHNSNFFRREQCKWRLCGGMWGKNGCPSYSKQASSGS
ncbi:MAG TPA: hypothetical protein VJ654_07995 [Noviherbaspirillum sp.]|nr:hypothetical protein [Noviherbaspirillum sp.]